MPVLDHLATAASAAGAATPAPPAAPAAEGRPDEPEDQEDPQDPEEDAEEAEAEAVAVRPSPPVVPRYHRHRIAGCRGLLRRHRESGRHARVVDGRADADRN